MQSKQASKIFEALSSDVRLDLFRLLVKNAPDGLVQGDIAKHLDIPSTNLSFHLKGIVQSGLVDVEREGRYMRYKANIPLMLDICGLSDRRMLLGQSGSLPAFQGRQPHKGRHTAEAVSRGAGFFLWQQVN